MRKGLINQRAGNSLIIFDTDKSILYTFNKTAKFIFERLKKGMAADLIAKQLTNEFDISSSQAKKDIDRLTSTLIKKKIAEKVNDAKDNILSLKQ